MRNDRDFPAYVLVVVEGVDKGGGEGESFAGPLMTGEDEWERTVLVEGLDCKAGSV
jgi:hypothetical protein